jgi:hypothetical protein
MQLSTVDTPALNCGCDFGLKKQIHQRPLKRDVDNKIKNKLTIG